MQRQTSKKLSGVNVEIERHLPRLIALPLPDLEGVKRPSLSIPSGYPRLSRKFTPDENDYHNKAIADSIDALCALVELTLTFLKDVAFVAPPTLGSGSRRKQSFPEMAKFWLREVSDGIVLMEEAMLAGWPDQESGGLRYESEGVSGLRYLFENPDPSDVENEGQSEAEKLSNKLLSFWLTEISRRVREVTHICAGTISVQDARDSFKIMNSLCYPIR